MRICELPLTERPRERLAALGTRALSSAELIAILLRTGNKEKSALELAQELLGCFGSVEALSKASLSEMSQVKGIGPAKAVELKAAFAIGLRAQEGKLKETVHSPEEAYQALKSLFEGQTVECCGVGLRDVRGAIFHKSLIAIGTLTHVLIHPREVFQFAIRHGAHRVIIAHNHPTGDPTPSKADLALTHQLAVAGEIVGIPLDDHLILGQKSFHSLWQQGIISRSIY